MEYSRNMDEIYEKKFIRDFFCKYVNLGNVEKDEIEKYFWKVRLKRENFLIIIEKFVSRMSRLSLL